jgi:hypothetical protein
MKTQIRILVALAMIASAACSKKKEEAVPVPVPSPTAGYSSLDDFEQDVKLVPQTYQLDNATGGIITGNEGTQLTFTATSFVHQNGTPVTGSVNIELYEANKKSEMILGGVYTATATVPLISGGQFKFVVSQNGEQLKFAPSKTAGINIPTASPDNNMTGYLQNSASADFYYISGDSSSSAIYLNGTQYSGFTESMIWVNCDHPFIQSTYKTLTVLPGSDFNRTNSQILLIFKNRNTAVKISGSTTDFVYYYAPQGYDITVVGIGVKNGNLYSAFFPVTISSDQTITMSFAQTTKEQLKTQLTALD